MLIDLRKRNIYVPVVFMLTIILYIHMSEPPELCKKIKPNYAKNHAFFVKLCG